MSTRAFLERDTRYPQESEFLEVGSESDGYYEGCESWDSEDDTEENNVSDDILNMLEGKWD